ncbi:MAG TPA: UvrD-helicase domain-containing protein [Victivallales bacterium]|nr:UvrD-helicase domain-containing protein [Victivallales bacterium]HRR05738.1 UvrD-helicase domain-containing protein [Victivallales bacterium]HRR28850.1 UvrD-helicase domain-containing protein [Victivallales bacterium]HRU01139.1 UvrD-helicase domain-containing protein [Victivallales bacterium]
MIIQNEAISASAGTGKTYQLVNRYISLLIAGAKPEEIVVLTFTRNAAGEIFERIIQRLIQLIQNPEKNKDELSISREKNIEILSNILLSMHKLQIGTLDSFFVKIMTFFAFELGLPGKISIIDEQMQDYVRMTVLKKVLNSISNEQDLRNFIEDFKKSTFGVEEKRIFNLLKNYIESHHQLYILCPDESMWGNPEKIWEKNSIIFQKYDINSLSTKLKELLEKRKDLGDKEIKKITDFAEIASIIDTNPTLKLDQSPNNFSNIISAYESFKQGNATIKVGHKSITFSNEECAIIAKIIEYIAKIKFEKQLNKTAGIYKIIKRYEESYDTVIRSSGIITFQDIPYLLSPDKILGENHYILSSHRVNSADKLYIDYRLDSRFSHWLIDEFQDTSIIQWAIIENLIDEVIQDTSGKKSFFYVGDQKQSIYSWRGGRPEIFDNILEKYSDKIKRRELTKSYRSSPEIINTINKVFANIQNLQFLPQELKEKWKFSQHTPRSEANKGYCALFQIKNTDKLKKDNLIELKAKFISEKIGMISPLERGFSVAVLCRKNDTAKEIAKHLHLLGIPAIYEGENKLTDNAVIPAFISLFKFVEHPIDNFAWQHLQMTPFRELIGTDKEKLILLILEQIHQMAFSKTIIFWKNKLEKEANIRFDNFNLMRIKQFIEAAEIFDKSGDKNCSNFINFINNYSAPKNNSENFVQCITIHKAKGLEFDIVFLPELYEQNSIITDKLSDGIKEKRDKNLKTKTVFLFPEKFISEIDPELKKWISELNIESAYENICVLYVAMTRARDALYMIADPPLKNETAVVRSQDILIKTLTGDKKNEDENTFQLLYEEGNEDWFNCLEKEENFIADEKEEKEIHPIELFSTEPEALTPSAIKTESYLSVNKIFSESAEEALEIGTIIHYLFEQIEWIDNENVENIIMRCKPKFKKIISNENVINKAIELFKKAINACEIRNELSFPAGKKCKLWREKAFSIIINNKLVNGQFDRVTIIEDEFGNAEDAIILDYKSDEISLESEIPLAVEHHYAQLDLYRKALSRLIDLPEEKIHAKIAFISIGKIINVPFHISEKRDMPTY